jgi:hypothetical protein
MQPTIAGQDATCAAHVITSGMSSAVTWWALGAAGVASAAASSVASGMLVSAGAAVEDGAGASMIFAGGWLVGASSMASSCKSTDWQAGVGCFSACRTARNSASGTQHQAATTAASCKRMSRDTGRYAEGDVCRTAGVPQGSAPWQ